jgi:hypothetical protein
LLRSIETGPFLETGLATNKRIRAKAEKKFSALCLPKTSSVQLKRHARTR